ncbi:MAG: hypothetical protein ACRCYY_00375 [Trueperaceae bacterium]
MNADKVPLSFLLRHLATALHQGCASGEGWQATTQKTSSGFQVLGAGQRPYTKSNQPITNSRNFLWCSQPWEVCNLPAYIFHFAEDFYAHVLNDFTSEEKYAWEVCQQFYRRGVSLFVVSHYRGKWNYKFNRRHLNHAADETGAFVACEIVRKLLAAGVVQPHLDSSGE